MTILTVEHTISMGHRLPSYQGICSSPHGHNARFVVQIDSKDEFIDFKYLRDTLCQVLEPMDHAMVLHDDDPLLPILKGMNFRVVQMSEEPTTEAIARRVLSFMRARCAPVVVLSVTMHETDKYAAEAW